MGAWARKQAPRRSPWPATAD